MFLLLLAARALGASARADCCSRDHGRADQDEHASDRSRGALADWRQAFGCNGCGDQRHRAQIHDADDEQNGHQVCAAANAVRAEA
jgi:hypothetical protein